MGAGSARASLAIFLGVAPLSAVFFLALGLGTLRECALALALLPIVLLGGLAGHRPQATGSRNAAPMAGEHRDRAGRSDARRGLKTDLEGGRLPCKDQRASTGEHDHAADEISLPAGGVTGFY